MARRPALTAILLAVLASAMDAGAQAGGTTIWSRRAASQWDHVVTLTAGHVYEIDFR